MPTFNESSLRAFSSFQLLSNHIQPIILEMLKDDRLNSYGGLKRPPNAWLIFRSDMLAANPDLSSMSQAEATVRCKSRWAVATPQERMELQVRARQANDELLQYFPDYLYKPMSTADKERWKNLGAHQRKEFWLSSAVRIAERIASPNKHWDGFLTLEKWAEQQTSTGFPVIKYEPESTQLHSVDPLETECTSEPDSQPSARLASRPHRNRNKLNNGPIGESNSTADSLRTPSSRFHPYGKHSGSPVETHERAQVRTRPNAAKKSLLPDCLRGVLVHVGPQTRSSLRRRLVLSMFQLKDKVVWVSEEVDDDVSDGVFETLSNSASPDEKSSEHLVLREFTDPWIPEAINEHGECFCPSIGTISEYYEYMAAYCSAQESSSEFTWPPLPQPLSSSLSPSLLSTQYPTPLVQTTELASSTFHSSSPLEDPPSNPNNETSSLEMYKSFPSTGRISGLDSDSDSDSDSDPATTPEDDLGWDESMSLDIMGDFEHGELEGFEFGLQ